MWEAICIWRSVGGLEVKEVPSAGIFVLFHHKKEEQRCSELETQLNGVQNAESTHLKAVLEKRRKAEKRLGSE